MTIRQALRHLRALYPSWEWRSHIHENGVGSLEYRPWHKCLWLHWCWHEDAEKDVTRELEMVEEADI